MPRFVGSSVPWKILLRACQPWDTKRKINNGQALRESGAFRTVLGVVLSAGNLLNEGNRRRGNADAFKLAILSNLASVSTASGKSNLLRYVVDQVAPGVVLGVVCACARVGGCLHVWRGHVTARAPSRAPTVPRTHAYSHVRAQNADPGAVPGRGVAA